MPEPIVNDTCHRTLLATSPINHTKNRVIDAPDLSAGRDLELQE